GPPGGPPGSSPTSGAAPGSGSGPGAAEGLIQVRVDPAKMPRADALRPFLFPGSFAIVADDPSVRIVTRKAFPNVVGLSSSMAVSAALPAITRARQAASGVPPAGGAAPAPAPAPGTGAG